MVGNCLCENILIVFHSLYILGVPCQKWTVICKGIFHEDSLFTPCTLYMANEVCPYDIPVYHRLVREGSITHYVNPKRCYDLCFVINELLSFSSRYVCSKDKKSWRNCVADCVNELLF